MSANRFPAFEYHYDDWPSIPVQIDNPANGRWVMTRLTLDTGADVTILDERLGRYLQIDLEERESLRVRGFGGLILGKPAIADIAPLGRSDLKVRVEAIFVPGVSSQLGSVLGLDYFAVVDMSLSHANNYVSLQMS